MKTRLGYLFILMCMLLVVACKNTPAASGSDASPASDEGAGGCEGEKAKAILWIDFDKKKMPLPDRTPVKTVKVLAQVSEDGKFKVLSFCKKQPLRVKDYILKKVEFYTIRKEIFEENYLKPGEQYLQLRYVPGWIK